MISKKSKLCVLGNKFKKVVDNQLNLSYTTHIETKSEKNTIKLTEFLTRTK